MVILNYILTNFNLRLDSGENFMPLGKGKIPFQSESFLSNVYPVDKNSTEHRVKRSSFFIGTTHFFE